MNKKKNSDSKMPNGKKPDLNMIEMLVCPQTKAPLEYDKKKQVLISHSAKKIYRIENGVPIMLEAESEPL